MSLRLAGPAGPTLIISKRQVLEHRFVLAFVSQSSTTSPDADPAPALLFDIHCGFQPWLLGPDGPPLEPFSSASSARPTLVPASALAAAATVAVIVVWAESTWSAAAAFRLRGFDTTEIVGAAAAAYLWSMPALGKTSARGFAKTAVPRSEEESVPATVCMTMARLQRHCATGAALVRVWPHTRQAHLLSRHLLHTVRDFCLGNGHELGSHRVQLHELLVAPSTPSGLVSDRSAGPGMVVVLWYLDGSSSGA